MIFTFAEREILDTCLEVFVSQLVLNDLDEGFLDDDGCSAEWLEKHFDAFKQSMEEKFGKPAVRYIDRWYEAALENQRSSIDKELEAEEDES